MDKSLFRYYVKRTGQAVFTTWATLTVTFLLIRWLPGGPMDFLMAQLMAGNIGPGQSFSSSSSRAVTKVFKEVAQLYININPTKPIYIQYINWLSDVIHGRLGTSIYYQKPVLDVIAPMVPWTAFLVSLAVIMSFLQQIIIGGLLANYEGTRLDIGATTFMVWSQAIPFFVWGLLLLYFLAFQLQLFPVGGKVNPSAPVGLNWAYIAGILNHAALPVISLAWATLGAGVLSMRANAIQVLGTDYVRIARLRGLNNRRISVRYIARNAILPMYTGFLLAISYIFGGSLILETIFSYRGMGWIMFRALQSRDFPLLMGGFILFTIATVIALYIADLTYPLIDPRIEQGESHETY